MTHDEELKYWTAYFAQHHKAPKREDTEVELWPEEGETLDDFIERCVEELTVCEGPAKAEIICRTKWSNSRKLGTKGLVTLSMVGSLAATAPCGKKCIACEGGVAPGQPKQKFDPNEPRDPHGRWTDGGAATDDHPGEGYSKDAYVDHKGVIHTNNVKDAARALAENKKVELKQPKQVSTLIKELGKQAQEMKKLGQKAPVYNLCNVSVAGTNLFCVQSKGIPRINMPQMDDEQTKAFRKYLEKKGYKVEKEKEFAANLRATQNELNGAKVAAIMDHLAGADDHQSKRLIVSRDDYILDGHHHWAGKLGLDAADGNLTNDTKLKIARVDIPIIKLLEEAETFTGGKGHKPATEETTSKSPFPVKFDPSEPRDPHGRWTEVGGGAGEESGFEFVSPNVEHLGLTSARSQLKGQRQAALRLASHEVDDQLGVTSSDTNIIGAWQDGAENSIMSISKGATWDQLHVSAAMKGYLADQKSVLIFQDQTDGPAALYRFEASGDIDEIHNRLLAGGLAFHTLVPHKGGATVYVADLDGSLHDAIDKASGDADVEYRFGKAEFIGTTSEAGTDREQRDDARRAYGEIIKQSEVQGSQAVWGRVHRRWGETLNPDNDSFVREKNGDANNKLVAESEGEAHFLTDVTGYESSEGTIGFLTPDGHVLETSNTHQTDAYRAGTSLDEVLREGGARVFIQPQDYVGLEIYKRPSQQQYNVIREAVQRGKVTRFHIEDHAWETITAPEGHFVTPREALNSINKIFPVMPEARTDQELAFWSAYFKQWHSKYNPYHEPGGQPTGGQFAHGPGGTGGEAEEHKPIDPPAKPPQLLPSVVDVGGDQWNQQTARRLEDEYQQAKPALQEIVNHAVGKEAVGAVPSDWKVVPHPSGTGFAIQNALGEFGKNQDGTAVMQFDSEVEAQNAAIDLYAEEQHPYDEDEEEEPFVPDEWESMSDVDQSAAWEAYSSDNIDNFIQDEQSTWYENGNALDDAKTKIVDEFNDGDEYEWADDAISEVKEELHIPYTTEQLLNAIDLEYQSGYEGSGKFTVNWDDKELQEPEGYLGGPGQLTLPGVPEVKPADYLTEQMRAHLEMALEKKFDSLAEDVENHLEPPDYLVDGAKEMMEEYWDNLPNEDKFQYVVDHTSILDAYKDENGKIGKLGGYTQIEELPHHYDPLNNSSGKDYQRTQAVARYLSIQRAVQVLTARKVTGLLQGGALEQALISVDSNLWSAWKGSSTSDGGKLLQVAAAEELGGRLRTTTIDAGPMKAYANSHFKKIGGYAGIKAYVRAKWETTQYLLEKADVHELRLYRAVGIDQDILEKWLKQVTKPIAGSGTYSSVHWDLLPNLKIERNGAASTTTDRGVANRWGYSERRVVLRAVMPRTAVLSVPAYGINVHSEHEVVVAGTAWKGWDAFRGQAPDLHEVPLQEAA